MNNIKHYFIVNPKAGKKDISDLISKEIKEKLIINKDSYEIYVTKEKKDATRYVNDICRKENGDLRFYAIGGDGTLNEVVNGAKDFGHASLSVIPYGTGNDFIKNFKHSNFLNVKNHINGNKIKVDLLNIGENSSVNLCNIGFDAKVASNMNKLKKIPFIKGQLAYTLSIFYSIISKVYDRIEVTIDDNEIIKGNFLLCAIANGSYYGGGYMGAPLAEIDDGVMDICLVKKIPRYKMLSFVSIYKKGEHLTNGKIKPHIIYKKCKKIKITSKNNFTIALDGEIYEDNNLEVSIKEKAINFIVPYDIES